MTPIGNQPNPAMLAKQRTQAAIAVGAIAFVAIGAVAWIGLEAVRTPPNPKLVYSSAPPAGTANQLMMALKVPRQRENEAARLAMLNDDDGPMVVKPLESVVELTQIDRAKLSQSANVAPAKPKPAARNVSITEAAKLVAVEEPVIAAATAPTCVEDLREFANKQTILFGSGSAQLEGSELPTLRKIGKMAQGCDAALVHVAGHSDSSGTDIINLALSWQRADNTVAALAALGIDTAQFEPVGFGARSPSAQGDASDEELNRRVEFIVFEKTEQGQ